MHIDSKICHFIDLCINPGNNFPGIALQFAMHFLYACYTNIFCVSVSFHRCVQNFIRNINPSAEIANQIWGGKLFPEILWKMHFIRVSLPISCAYGVTVCLPVNLVFGGTPVEAEAVLGVEENSQILGLTGAWQKKKRQNIFLVSLFKVVRQEEICHLNLLLQYINIQLEHW